MLFTLIFLAAQEDTTSLASQMTSTDSGIWSENGSKAYQTVDINHNGLEVKGHYRENSYGGSSGYGSVSSQNGGARPKLVMGTDIPKVQVFFCCEVFFKWNRYTCKHGNRQKCVSSLI